MFFCSQIALCALWLYTNKNWSVFNVTESPLNLILTGPPPLQTFPVGTCEINLTDLKRKTECRTLPPLQCIPFVLLEGRAF